MLIAAICALASLRKDLGLVSLSPCLQRKVTGIALAYGCQKGNTPGVDWQPIGEKSKRLYVPVTVNGKAARAYLATEQPYTEYGPSFLDSKEHPDSIDIVFPGGVRHKIPAKYDPDLNPEIPFVLSCDGLDGMVLVLDHAKRFVLMTDDEWEKNAFDLVGYKSIVVGLKADVVKRLHHSLRIAGVQCWGQIATGFSLVGVSVEFAKESKLKPNRSEPLRSYQSAGTMSYCDDASIRLDPSFAPDKTTIAIIPESALSSSEKISLVGLDAFKNHIVAIRFSKSDMIITPN